MTDANARDETIMRELNDLFISDIDETREEQESFSLHEEAATDDIPPSLISYFEASRSRAAVCEKLILEEPKEDFTTSYEDMMNLPVELSREMVKLKEQVVSETGNENRSSTDSCLLHDPTETEALVTHHVEVCPNSEDGTGTDENVENEKHLTLKVDILKTSVIEKEIKETSEDQRDHTENQHFEEMKKEEQIRRREKDFQEELKKLMEAEKLHQMELQLMEKRAQEKLEQELLLQQELISNLQKQVEEERRLMEEEMKRIKEEKEKKKREEEEDRKKSEEEKIKRKLQIERMEEEMRKVKEEEENRKIREMKAEEEKRNKEEEQRKKKEEEEKRRREEKNKMEKELRKKEEERKNEIRLKEEEKRRQMEEEERKNKEIGDKIKEKEKNREREEEEETMKREEVIKVTVKKMEGDKKGKNEKEIIRKDDWRKEEVKTRVEEDKTKVEEVRITKELEMKTQKEEKKEGERKSEEERKKAEIEKTMDEQVKKKKEENRQMQLSQDTEKKKNDVERRRSIENKCIMKEEEKMKEEEWKKGHEEEIRQKEEKYIIQINTDIQKYSEMKEEIKIKEGNKTYKADEWQMKEELSENKEGTIKTDERRLKEEEESKMIVVQETEKEARLKIVNELQEKKRENNSVNTQNERKNRGSTGHSLTSQLEDNSTWTSVGPGPLHSDSSSFEIVQQGDQDRNINKTNDQQDPAVKLYISPSSLLLYLPDHTEQKRLSWIKDCVPWSKLSLQNRRKQKVSVRTQRFLRRAAEASSLPPLCPDTLLQSTGCKSLQEVTTVTLKDLPGCILSSLVQCTQLRSLTMRRCGLKSLEGISQLSELCYIDVEENEISFVNCENMTSLRVLRLGHNKLTSIHGLSGSDNLDVLELSHNNITRVAGLESMRRLQRLSVDHNQLISTKGLRDVYTLLHLNCSHNHLASVEGLENSALLNTLDISANSLTEPPSLDNHVLLRELRLDDNSVSSLQGLSGCWLPLLQHLSVAQNRITQLPSMSDFVSLANLDLRFNCMSELQNVCESLEGCQFLQTIHLTGNPLQQESGWRSTLQKALPGLKAIDDQDTDSFLSHPAVQEISFASVSFLTFCQAQFQQINDFQQQHSRELSKASSSLDAMKSFCQHFTETLKLAKEQRFAHECGDITVSACQTVLEKTAAMESTNAEKFTGNSQKASPADIPSRNDIKCSYWTFEGKSSTESWPHTSDTVTTIPKTGLHSLTTKEKTSSSNIKMAALSNHQDLDLKNSTAAVVIQQQWREYKQKCANINGPPAAEKGGRSGGNPESGPFHINRSVVDQHYAATIIQAFWRGCSVRKRLASALAAVTCPISREDDTFEEVDVDEFVFDEAALEKHWTLQLSEDSSSRHDTLSEQPLSLKFPGSFPDPSHYTLPPPPVWRPKQAWVAGEELDSAGQRGSSESSHRKSPESTSVISGISERSEKILEEWGFTDSHTALLMLKRAQKMKSKQQPKKKHGDPSVRLALFRNCHYQLGPVEARNRPSPHSRNHKKVCKAELGLQQAERTEQMKEGSQQWLHTQSDRSAESEHFLPEISSDILNGGRVQLVCVQADPTYTERHHTSGLWASNSLAAQPSKQNSSHRISLGHARKDVPAPKRATSAPSKKERISFRDNPVQLSGGWGGGKKRDKVHK